MKTTWTAAAGMALALASAPAAAQTPEFTVAGNWVLDAERSQSVQDAMAAARGGAGGGMAMRAGGGAGGGGGGGAVMIRPGGAGGGIMGVLQGGQRLNIVQDAEQVTIRQDDGAPVTLPLNGEAVQVTRWDQPVRALARVEGSTLTVETTLQNGGVVTETFSAAEGELTAELRMPLPMMGAGAEPPTVTLKRVYTPAP
jgi:hypothetical protein